MAGRTRRSDRRTEALSRDRIVEAAVELLDATGEGGLTFRALTERLSTGPGAIYWHVANKDELLGAATEGVVAAAVAAGSPDAPDSSDSSDSPGAPGAPREVIRAVALGLFDAVAAHSWLGTQLAVQMSRTPWGLVTASIFERIGRQVQVLGVPERDWFTATSTLVHYILGAAGQNASNARTPHLDGSRAEFLDAVSAAWERLDPREYSFTRAIARQVRGHDDREQFLAGIDFILAGVMAR